MHVSKLQQLVGVAASHHRLLWIHPFLDGNGRVARLMSHALLKQLGVGSTLWPISRGLARSVDEYKAHLQAADEPRKGDLDGRGNLSRANLVAFCEYFLQQCLGQVHFMEQLLTPRSLRSRIDQHIREEEANGILAQGAHKLMKAAFDHGEIPRGEVPSIVQASERTGQRITKSLVQNEYLVSEGHTEPLLFNIPTAARDRWFPSLYPSFPQSRAAVVNTICKAIEQRSLLAFDYKGLTRVVQPYVHGETPTGQESLRAIQIRGRSSKGGMGSGKLWTVSEMQNVRILPETFVPDDPDYNPDDRHMRAIHCRVER